MRHCFLLLIAALFLFVTTWGQTNIPTAVTAPPTVTPMKVPLVSLDPSPYYLRTLVPMKPITDSAQVNMNALVEEVSISTQYRDELSRPLQTVIRQASPLKKDYVSPVYYDEFGNISTGYLPYVQQTGNTNDGKYKDNALSSDSAFYKAAFPTEHIYYNKQFFDGSPLQRTTKVTAEGNNWTGANRGISSSQRANIAGDSVRLWVVNITGEDDVSSTTLRYAAGSLLVQEITDERGIKSVTYTDELGRTVLTKTQVSPSPGTAHMGWLCTYYVYDEMNQVRMVLPPKAVEALNTASVNWNLSGNIAIRNGLCYYYWYDFRGRAIMKYIPGKGKTYVAYDLYDRVVMTQDAKIRATNQWAFVKYDGQSRPSKSGLITSALIKDSIIAQASRSLDYPTLTGTYTITSEAYYDDYSWIAATGAPVTNTLVTTNINSTNFNTNYNTSPEYAQQITVSNRIRGTVTGSKRIILGTSTYLWSVTLYDERGRTIQAKQTNYTTGTDVTTVQYSFAGRVLRTHVAHQKSGTNAQTHTLLTKYSYDHVGRIKNVVKNIDGLGDKTISQNTYNELGQLQSKIIGTNTETQNFEYNIRGWLTAINKDFINTAGSTSNFFGEALAYDYGFTNNQYNGAIAGVKWKAAGDGTARAYGFTYDNANRLTIADFSQQNSGATSWTNDKVDFAVSGLNYDAGSNILSMKQRGVKVGSNATIDSLTYTYFANSNQLQKVADLSPTGGAGGGSLGDFQDTSLTADDYVYDVNGNITKDNNRHMHTTANANGAVYNVLDKPDSMVIAGKATIYSYYDAAGARLRKQVNPVGGVAKNYLYINGFVYCNDTLQYVMQEEGRIRWAQKRNSTTGAIYYAFEYDYFLRDHLGNVRTVLTEGRDTSTYAATMESADSVVVRALFSNVYDPVNTVLAKPTGFDTDGANQKVSRLNATSGINKKIGPSLVLKVMAGDKVQISTYAFYNTAVQPPPGGVDLTSEILSLLSNGVVNNSGGKITSTSAVSTAVNPGVTNFLNNNRPYDNQRPKAYLNWILFDNQFNYIASNSGVQQSQPGASKQALIAPLQTISKNGYLYIYVSNESQQDVYFDDLNVKHYTGPLVQEQSYYPFGLQMAGISDKALNKLSSQYKFNGGVELEEDFGVNLYSTFFRQYDPQLGRFNGVDALSEYMAAIGPYHYSANNPISFNDPSGAVLEGPYYKPMEGVTVVGTRRKKHVSTFLNDVLSWGNSDPGFNFELPNFGSGDQSGGGGSGITVNTTDFKRVGNNINVSASIVYNVAVINLSQKKFTDMEMDLFLRGIETYSEYSFSGTDTYQYYDRGDVKPNGDLGPLLTVNVNLKFDFKTTQIKSLAEVRSTDIVLAIVNTIEADESGEVIGIANRMTGNMAAVESEYATAIHFTSIHEIGHLLGLGHTQASGFLMSDDGKIAFGMQGDEIRTIAQTLGIDARSKIGSRKVSLSANSKASIESWMFQKGIK